MDPILNCILAVCCPPEAARDALAKFLITNGDVNADDAIKAAECIAKYFDLAEKGTLQAFKDSVARLARGADYKE